MIKMAKGKVMLLFLDFDGTTHRDRCSVDEYFRRSEAVLEPWLRSRPDVGVVISSSWRESFPLTEMKEFFADDIKSRIIGATPVLKQDAWAEFGGEMGPERFPREAEVLKWLKSSGAPWRPWAALDDQPWLFRPFNRRLVVCDGRIGMTATDLERVDAIFRDQL